MLGDLLDNQRVRVHVARIRPYADAFPNGTEGMDEKVARNSERKRNADGGCANLGRTMGRAMVWLSGLDFTEDSLGNQPGTFARICHDVLRENCTR